MKYVRIVAAATLLLACGSRAQQPDAGNGASTPSNQPKGEAKQTAGKSDLPPLPSVGSDDKSLPPPVIRASGFSNSDPDESKGDAKVRRAFPDLRQNYKGVKPVVFDEESKRVPDIWVLDFQFRDPRYITVDIPGKGRTTVWYMTYKVVNRTGEPRTFVPQFTIVVETGKAPGKVVHDVILPSAEKAVRMKEDPTVELYNSVTIASQPIPPTPPVDAIPIERNGVVFWEGVEGTDENVKAFDLYVTGLSNGYTQLEDPKTKEVVLRRKTLRLKFAKPGDTSNTYRQKIEFTGDPTWLYR